MRIIQRLHSPKPRITEYHSMRNTIERRLENSYFFQAVSSKDDVLVIWCYMAKGKLVEMLYMFAYICSFMCLFVWVSARVDKDQ